METYKFEIICKNIIIDCYRDTLYQPNSIDLNIKDVFVVWSCKTLQNNKALLSTKLFDGFYYEITYNGDKKEIYVDAYKKHLNYKVDEKDFNSEVTL